MSLQYSHSSCKSGSQNNLLGGVCMKGSISFRKDRGYFEVSWWHRGKTYKINQYKGQRLYARELALKLLASMQGDVENKSFRIQKYTREIPTDVIPYLWEWLETIGPTLKPATYKDYFNSIKNHLIPFFRKSPLELHEVQYDVILRLLNSIKRTGKGKLNVMYCLHDCLDFACRSGRIQAIPSFPQRKQYKIIEPIIKWITEDRQRALIEAIEPEHQPIFWWLKYHYRRPSEACALHKKDFDGQVFSIHRTFSARVLVESTKTGKEHQIPIVEEFKPILKTYLSLQKKWGIVSPFFFINPNGKKPGKHYTNSAMNVIWKRACKRVGETIDLYSGTKHSSCSQFLNEKGGNFSELQIITDHAGYDSVKRYGKVEVHRRKELLDRKVIKLERKIKK